MTAGDSVGIVKLLLGSVNQPQPFECELRGAYSDNVGDFAKTNGTIKPVTTKKRSGFGILTANARFDFHSALPTSMRIPTRPMHGDFTNQQWVQAPTMGSPTIEGHHFIGEFGQAPRRQASIACTASQRNMS